jgi:hypothetical protein
MMNLWQQLDVLDFITYKKKFKTSTSIRLSAAHQPQQTKQLMK